MSTDEQRLRLALAGRYTLESSIGAGGMATVYLARDVKHSREVAIKVLRAEVAGVLGAERFLREIAVTASLEHPNILPLLDSGNADGQLYYVMPLVKGESLRDRITRDRQLPIDESLHIIAQVSAALTYAHSHGVIHRDVKPENIMLSEGQARVVDFGIARALSTVPGQTLTGTGLVVGSPAYMSPEQGSGEREVDSRSDVYATGCVLYEMLAGVPPFSGATIQSLIRQHLIAPPPDVRQLRPSVPPPVVAAITRALAKVPADRFSSPTLFAAALSDSNDTLLPQADVTPHSARRLRAVTERMAQLRWPVAVVVGMLVVVSAVVALRFARDHRPVKPDAKPRVAVLPFRNIGGGDDEYFADGITEEITSRLTTISAISVVSRTTALSYKGTAKPLRDIARELGVAYILEGTVRTERLADGSSQMRVTPELVPADNDSPLWTDRFTVSIAPGALFTVQAQIAERVANAFNVSIAAGERSVLTRQDTKSTEAHIAFLQGRFSQSRTSEAGIADAMRYFALAIAADSTYARAWAGLASAYASASYYPNATIADSVAFELSERYARHAIRLDSTLTDGYVVLASVLSFGRWQWADADAALRKALSLDPENARVLASRSTLLLALNRYDEALESAQRAVQLDPASSDFRHVCATALAATGRLDDAISNDRMVLASTPTYLFARIGLADVAALKSGIPAMGRELLALAPMSGIGRAMMKFDGTAGSKAEIVRAIAALQSSNPGLDVARKGWLLAVIGEQDKALDAFEIAIRVRSPGGVSAQQFPTVRKALGASPRYQALVKRVGLAQ